MFASSTAAQPLPISELARTGRFCGYFVPHVLAAPIWLFLGVTFLHELAHSAAALLLGGQVFDFVILPGPHNLGHMNWQPPPGAGAFEHDLVSVAPYLMWTAISISTIAFAALPNRLHWLSASSIFLFGYVAPLADIAGNLLNGSDLALPGPEGMLVQAVGSVGLLAAAVIGYWVQRRLFGDRSVGVMGYLASAFILGPAFGVGGLLGLAVLGTGQF